MVFCVTNKLNNLHVLHTFCRDAERNDAAANVIVTAGRQRASRPARGPRSGPGPRAQPGAAARRHGGAALHAPRRVQGGALPAAALRIPAAQPPSLPLRVPAAPAAARAPAAALPAAQGSYNIITDSVL